MLPDFASLATVPFHGQFIGDKFVNFKEFLAIETGNNFQPTVVIAERSEMDRGSLPPHPEQLLLASLP